MFLFLLPLLGADGIRDTTRVSERVSEPASDRLLSIDMKTKVVQHVESE